MNEPDNQSQAELVDYGEAFSSEWASLPKRIYDLDLSSRERDLFFLLSTYYNFRQEEPVYPQQKELGERLGWTARTVRKYLRKLEEKGLVVTTRRTDSRGAYTGNSYRLRLPKSRPECARRSERTGLGRP